MNHKCVLKVQLVCLQWLSNDISYNQQMLLISAENHFKFDGEKLFIVYEFVKVCLQSTHFYPEPSAC